MTVKQTHSLRAHTYTHTCALITIHTIALYNKTYFTHTHKYPNIHPLYRSNALHSKGKVYPKKTYGLFSDQLLHAL